MLDTVANGPSEAAYRPFLRKLGRRSQTRPNPPLIIRLDVSKSCDSISASMWRYSSE